MTAEEHHDDHGNTVSAWFLTVSWIVAWEVARTWARKREDSVRAQISRRLKSFQAGRMLRKSPARPRASYQPTPNPSPFVGVSREWELML